MKLVRYGAAGREKPGMIDDKGQIRDLSKVIPDLAGEALSPKSLAKLKKLRLRDLVDAAFVWFPRWASPAFYDRMMHESG